MRRRRSWRPLAYFSVLVLGGIALFVPGPWLASRAFHFDFTASFLIFTALVNIHHFILDGAIWKLRDGKIASLLLNSRDRISGAAAEASGHFTKLGQWLVGSTTAARSLRVGTAILLLVWGTVDQARYYLSLHTDDIHALERAEALNSFDSSVQMRLAHRAIEVGQPQQAEASWRRAMQANPIDPAPRQALLQFLIDQNRYDEAFTLTESSLKLTPKDANLLVDRGFLAQRRGHPDEALANWNQALTVDPGQRLAHLYIADELDREGKSRDAAAHYNSFLQRIAQLQPQDRPAPEKVIAIAMRMADCQARSSQTDLALKSYRLAEKLAVQTRQPKLESLADVNEAELQSKTGNLDETLQLYQRALTLDDQTADAAASAEDWFAYGKFLDAAGFPARLAYACILKSESVTQSLNHGAAPDSRAATRQQIEKRLGSAAAEVQRAPAPALQEALALRR